MSILLTNIQRFSLHDGPGIRTTVFLKGCSIRCPWCSNPENLISCPQKYVKDNIQGTYGQYYTPDELVKECLKDKAFFEGKLPRDSWMISDANDIDLLPGGVTFSGGEALLQMEQLVPVCEALHQQGVHIAVETCLFVPGKDLSLALEYIDFFYVDMKILDTQRCKEIVHGDLDLYLKNLEIILNSGKPVVVRIPVIGSYTDTPENRYAVRQLLRKYCDQILKVELIKEHNLGESKYKSLGVLMDYHGVSDELMEQYKIELSSLGLQISICKI